MTANKSIEISATETVRTIDPHTDSRWDDFVMRHPSGLVYHHSAWARVIESTYGHNPFYIAVENKDTGEITGAAPFFLVDSLFTGERVVSLPFATHCNPLASADALAVMTEFLSDLLPKARYIKLKLLDYDLGKMDMRVSCSTSSYVTHLLDLRRSLDQLFGSFHGSSVRQRIRRADRNKLTFRESESLDDLYGFYNLFKDLRKRHGLPPHPIAFFVNMWNFLKPAGLLKLAVVEHEKRMIAGSIVLRLGAKYHHEYSASEVASWKLCSNQKLLWEIIKMAHEDQAHFLDLGRSETNNTSLIEFKERWQGMEHRLAYCTLPFAEKQTSEVEEAGEKGVLRKCLESVNHHMPGWLLEWAGRAIYPHVDG